MCKTFLISLNTDCVDEDSTYSGNDLELELDLDLQTLTYFSRGKALATVRHVHGKQLFPFVIFHKENNQPVQILYCKGPTGEILIWLINYYSHQRTDQPLTVPL